MAHSQYKKNKAFGYFKEGWNAPDVAAKMKLPIRTCQRWMSEFLEANPIIESNLAVINDLSGQVSKIVTSSPEVIAEDFWISEAKALVIEHKEIHTKVRRKLGDLLVAAMEQPEYNLRALNTLSQALLRHSDFERQTLSLATLDINRAYKLLTDYGMIVLDPRVEADSD
ncbi:hypothetical protein [uncultured Nostoc sp.]|uniref:hypothetical protein n=1 Tax=uncultured Nostoc sp. TaxID=340711 RepID=UPI0026305E31|nr:hypothetical protein [uncultured Nostoc sp.]